MIKDRTLFFLGAAIGALLFIMVFGVQVLNVCNDGWIFALPDPDIEQHYIGWCHFRAAPWTFPLGLMDSLSYPYPMSVLWTDSMPIVAIFFKLFSGILPETFQYLGWYGLFSMALTGGLSALIIKKVTGSPIMSITGVIIFALSFPMQQRMFYHTTLTAHYLILLPIALWLYDIWKKPLKKKCLIWGLLSFLGVTIHPYLWAMGELILIFILLEEWLFTKNWRSIILQFVTSAVMAFLGLYIEGAFYGSVDVAWSIGGFESNFNTFFNSMGDGKLLPALPLQVGFQYEGFGYLGAGVLFMLLIGGIGFGCLRIMKGKKDSASDDGESSIAGESVDSSWNHEERGEIDVRRKEVKASEIKTVLEKGPESGTIEEKTVDIINMGGDSAAGSSLVLRQKKTRRILLIISFITFFTAAVFPKISFNEYLIFELPLPEALKHFFGIFRSNGRFIWVADYLIFTFAFWLLSRKPFSGRKRKWGIIICISCVLLQLYDMSDNLIKKHDIFTSDYKEESCDLDNPGLIANLQDYKHLVMVYSDHLDNMRFAFFAGKHGLTINRFYFARDIDDRMLDKLEEYYDEVLNNEAQSDCIYVMNKRVFDAGWGNMSLYYYDLDGTILGVKEPLKGMEEYSISQAAFYTPDTFLERM